MTQQIINIGNYNDDGTGDNLREGGRKINANFTELYDRTKTILKGVVAGDGISVNYSPTSGIATINNTRLFQSAFAEFIIPKPDSETDVWSIKANGASATVRLNAGDNVVIEGNEYADTIRISAVWPETFSGPTLGLHTGNVIGNLTGNVNGDLIGDVYASNGTSKVLESGTNGLNAIFYGNVIGDLTGNVIGNLRGNVTGNVIGNISGNAGSVTNGIYTTDIGSITNLMLAGGIQNSKLANSSITINSQSVNLGGSITIPQYQLPIASISALGGIKVGDSLQINSQTGILTTIQDIRATASPTFNGIISTANITIGTSPVNSAHAATKGYVDSSILAIPPYILPIAEPNLLGGIKVGTGLSINQTTGVLSTAQDISTTSTPTFNSMSIINSITLNRPPTSPSHATTKQYVDDIFASFAEYTLTYASETQLGGVRIGTGINIDVETGKISTAQDIRTTASPTFTAVVVANAPTDNIQLTNKKYVDDKIAAIPPYILPVASVTNLGGVKIGNSIQADAYGVISTIQDIRTTASPTFTAVVVANAPTDNIQLTNKKYVDDKIAAIPPYILPVASVTNLGGVKIGNSIQADAYGVISTIQDIRTTANPTFNSVNVATQVVIPNAPTQNNHAANKAYVDSKDNFPVGGIIMWSGSIASIPIKWALCDGANGTPDLRNRFIVGAGAAPMNSTGGASSSTTSISGDHIHSSSSGDTTLTLSQLPSHRHNFNDVWLIADDVYSNANLDGTTGRPARDANGNPADYFAMVGSSYGQYPLIRAYSDTNLDGGTNDNGIYTIANRTEYVGGNLPHNHTVTVNSAGNHTHTVSTMPPYYALAYIMKIS